jgi:hypothetical protein
MHQSQKRVYEKVHVASVPFCEIFLVNFNGGVVLRIGCWGYFCSIWIWMQCFLYQALKMVVLV